jgi:hypothetical protein
MRETERSLRAYFWVAGVLAIGYVLSTYHDVHVFFALLGGGQKAAISFALLSQLALGIAYIGCGIKLEAALPHGAQGIKNVLAASMALIPINGALISLAFGAAANTQSIVAAVIGLLIAIYLRANVKRLGAEAAARAGAPSPLPPAKVS